MINPNIPQARNVELKLVSNLDDWDGVTGPVDRDLRQVVVQKATIGKNYTYALQHVAGDTFVYRGHNGQNVNFNKNKPVLFMTETAAGHTQTFEYANKFGQYFVGTKPNDLNMSSTWSSWSKQIARVSLWHAQKYRSNTSVQPRLANLNHAGSDFGVGCAGDQFARVEAAVSPDGQYFLIAYGDNDHNGYFALYRLSAINDALDHATTASKYVDITTVQCLAAFKIPTLSGNQGQVGSLQGFALDHYVVNHNDQFNLYLSSQPSTDIAGFDRKIVKIPWGEVNAAGWELVDLTTATELAIPGYYTEVEGIQVVSNNNVLVTVAYHQLHDFANPTKHPTKINKIYQVTWGLL